MKRSQLLGSATGSAWLWFLIVLLAVMAVAFAAITFWPQPRVQKPSPAIARGKIPPLPVPTSEPQAETQPLTPSDSTGSASSEKGDPRGPNSVASSSQAANVSEPQSIPDESAAASMPASDRPDVAPNPETGRETQPPMPVEIPDSTSPDSMPADHSTIATKQEAHNTSDVLIAAPETKPQAQARPSDQTTPANEAAVDGADDTVDRLGSQQLVQQEGQSIANVQEESPFTIQVGAFHNRRYAENTANELKQLGYSAFIFDAKDGNQSHLYLVCFGGFKSRGQAAQSAETFKAKEKRSAFVVMLNER